MLLTINDSNVSLYCNLLYMSPINVGNEMVGNLVCELTCDLRELLVFADKMLRGEMCLDGICSVTGCNSSLNLASTW